MLNQGGPKRLQLKMLQDELARIFDCTAHYVVFMSLSVFVCVLKSQIYLSPLSLSLSASLSLSFSPFILLYLL